MLLVVLSVFGAKARCLRFIEAAKATKRFVECSLRTGGGMEDHRAARRHFGLSRYSYVEWRTVVPAEAPPAEASRPGAAFTCWIDDAAVEAWIRP